MKTFNILKLLLVFLKIILNFNIFFKFNIKYFFYYVIIVFFNYCKFIYYYVS